MVRMKALKTFRGKASEGRPKKGSEFDAADERRANELETHKLAERLGGKAERRAPQNRMEPPPLNKMEPSTWPHKELVPPQRVPTVVKDGAIQAGGDTGAESAPSSSEQVRRPRMRRLFPRTGEPESAS
jgi:hypothetical protein